MGCGASNDAASRNHNTTASRPNDYIACPAVSTAATAPATAGITNANNNSRNNNSGGGSAVPNKSGSGKIPNEIQPGDYACRGGEFLYPQEPWDDTAEAVVHFDVFDAFVKQILKLGDEHDAEEEGIRARIFARYGQQQQQPLQLQLPPGKIKTITNSNTSNTTNSATEQSNTKQQQHQRKVALHCITPAQRQEIRRKLWARIRNMLTHVVPYGREVPAPRNADDFAPLPPQLARMNTTLLALSVLTPVEMAVGLALPVEIVFDELLRGVAAGMLRMVMTRVCSWCQGNSPDFVGAIDEIVSTGSATGHSATSCWLCGGEVPVAELDQQRVLFTFNRDVIFLPIKKQPTCAYSDKVTAQILKRVLIPRSRQGGYYFDVDLRPGVYTLLCRVAGAKTFLEVKDSSGSATTTSGSFHQNQQQNKQHRDSDSLRSTNDMASSDHTTNNTASRSGAGPYASGGAVSNVSNLSGASAATQAPNLPPRVELTFDIAEMGEGNTVTADSGRIRLRIKNNQNSMLVFNIVALGPREFKEQLKQPKTENFFSVARALHRPLFQRLFGGGAHVVALRQSLLLERPVFLLASFTPPRMMHTLDISRLQDNVDKVTKIVSLCKGRVVKIGGALADTVFSVFYNPCAAATAMFELIALSCAEANEVSRRANANKNNSSNNQNIMNASSSSIAIENSRLRVAISSGPCALVRVNNQNEYVGATVALAQHLHDSCAEQEVLVTEEVWELSGCGNLFERMGTLAENISVSSRTIVDPYSLTMMRQQQHGPGKMQLLSPPARRGNNNKNNNGGSGSKSNTPRDKDASSGTDGSSSANENSLNPADKSGSGSGGAIAPGTFVVRSIALPLGAELAENGFDDDPFLACPADVFGDVELADFFPSRDGLCTDGFAIGREAWTSLSQRPTDGDYHGPVK